MWGLRCGLCVGFSAVRPLRSPRSPPPAGYAVVSISSLPLSPPLPWSPCAPTRRRRRHLLVRLRCRFRRPASPPTACAAPLRAVVAPVAPYADASSLLLATLPT